MAKNLNINTTRRKLLNEAFNEVSKNISNAKKVRLRKSGNKSNLAYFKRNELKRYLRQLHRESREELILHVCENWKYCEKYEKYKKSGALWAGIGDFAIACTGIPGPCFLSWCIVNAKFETLCECPKINIQ